MTENMPTRFRITYTKGAYYVSIPNYAGGEVVDATVADALVDALKDAAEALANCYQITDYPANGKTEQDYALARARSVLALVGSPTGERT